MAKPPIQTQLATPVLPSSTAEGGRNASSSSSPAQLGFTMPAEWEPHEATWLGWPHNATDWPGKLKAIEWAYGEMVRKIAPGEMVRLLVDSPAQEKLARRILAQAGADLKRVKFLRWPTNRGWM